VAAVPARIVRLSLCAVRLRVRSPGGAGARFRCVAAGRLGSLVARSVEVSGRVVPVCGGRAAAARSVAGVLVPAFHG